MLLFTGLLLVGENIFLVPIFWDHVPSFTGRTHRPLLVLLSRHRQVRDSSTGCPPCFALWSAHQPAARVRVPHPFGEVEFDKRRYCLKPYCYQKRRHGLRAKRLIASHIARPYPEWSASQTRDLRESTSQVVIAMTQASKNIDPDPAGRSFALLRRVLNVVSAYGGGRAWHCIVSVPW